VGARGQVHAGDGGGGGRREGKQRGLAAAQGQARTDPAAQQGGRGRRGRRRGAPAAGGRRRLGREKPLAAETDRT
jgi:hypothetical protein